MSHPFQLCCFRAAPAVPPLSVSLPRRVESISSCLYDTREEEPGGPEGAWGAEGAWGWGTEPTSPTCTP